METKSIIIDETIHRPLKLEADKQGLKLKELVERICREYLDGLSKGERT